MLNRHLIVSLAAAVLLFAGLQWLSDDPAALAAQETRAAEPDKLAIVWTSGDPDVAHRMTLMYGNAAKRSNWFNEVQLIIWGPSQRLVVSDKDILAYINRLRETGVEVVACQACSDSFGITQQLRDLGLEVKYMGAPLTSHLKSAEWAVLTF